MKMPRKQELLFIRKPELCAKAAFERWALNLIDEC